MKKERFRVARVVDVEGTELPGQPVWHMLRSRLRVEAFGVNAWTSTEAGQSLIGEHDEVSDGDQEHEELYVVLSGWPRSRWTVSRSPCPPARSCS